MAGNVIPIEGDGPTPHHHDALFKGLFTFMTNGVAIYQPVDGGEDFRFIDINPAGEQLSRVTREQVIGRTIREMFPGVEELGLLEVLRSVHATGESRHLPMSEYSDDRITEWVENYVFRLPGGEVVAVYDDLTERKNVELALQHSEERYRLAVQGSNDGLWDLNLATEQLYISPAWKRMVGYEEEELTSDLETFNRLIHPDDKEATWAAFHRYVEGDAPKFEVEFRLRHKRGHHIDILSRGYLIADAQGRPIRVIGTHLDITERKRAELRLRLWATVSESTSEGVMITDRDGCIVAINRSFSAITGYRESEALGQTPALLRSDRHEEDFYQQMWRRLKEQGAWTGEIWNRRKSGEVYPEWLNINAVTDADGEVSHYVGVFSDISDIKNSQARLEHLAHHDPLTDLPNRLLFHARIVHALERARRHAGHVAVMFIDLDRFKNINDSYGHPFGDTLLSAVARRIAGCVREEDTVARIGGDEFAVLLDDVPSSSEAIRVVEKLMEAFSGATPCGDRELFVTVSVGVSLFPQDGDDARELLRNADTAMYRAKEEGRNTYRFYTEEMTRRAFDRMFLETSLHRSVERDELFLTYQPKVELAGGRLIGVEALVRWRHPDMGIIGPDRFIPLAEESGFIIPLGEWVLHRACRQIRQWMDEGFDVGRVAVNVAGPQLRRGDLVNSVKRALRENGLNGERLVIEVTESFIMSEAERTAEILDALRAEGVRIAIDDFGTGYSSLSYLKRLPVDELKIDRSFVNDLPDNGEDVAIARAIITLAEVMEMEVVAEGVESEAQQAFLHTAGCGVGQGYLYSRPVVAEELMAAWAPAG